MKDIAPVVVQERGYSGKTVMRGISYQENIWLPGIMKKMFMHNQEVIIDLMKAIQPDMLYS
jgi:hypothetical protein